MGGFPCDCCEEQPCDCLTYSELPNITIPGYIVAIPNGGIGLPWQQAGDCCWKRIFYPSQEPAWTCFSETMQSYEWNLTCNTKAFTWKNYTPPVFQGNQQVPCPLPESFCCPQDLTPVEVGTTQSIFNFRGSVQFFLFYRISRIEVYLSRKKLLCGNSEVCKYVLASKMFYEYKSGAHINDEYKVTRQASVLLSCFSENPNYDYTSVNDDNADENGWVPGLAGLRKSCNDVDATFINGISSNAFSFDRVKLFNTLPTGNVQFTNSDVLSNLSCELSMSSLCLTQLNQDTQVCIYSPTSQEDSRGSDPCWCSMEVAALPVTNAILPNRCNASFPPNTPRTQYYVYYCETGAGLEPGGTTCVVLSGGCEDTKPPCATYPQQCEPSLTGWATHADINCLGALSPKDINFLPYFDCGCSQYFLITPGTPPVVEPIFTWTATCQPNNCNATCCNTFTMDCPECEVSNPYKCYQAYLTSFGGSLPMIRSITSRTLTWNCSGVTQRSHCIDAPSWTLVFPT